MALYSLDFKLSVYAPFALFIARSLLYSYCRAGFHARICSRDSFIRYNRAYAILRCEINMKIVEKLSKTEIDKFVFYPILLYKINQVSLLNIFIISC